jgi:hypothetical protein
MAPRTVVESPARALRRELGLPEITRSNRPHVDDWYGLNTGDLVREKEGRHWGRAGVGTVVPPVSPLFLKGTPVEFDGIARFLDGRISPIVISSKSLSENISEDYKVFGA